MASEIGFLIMMDLRIILMSENTCDCLGMRPDALEWLILVWVLARIVNEVSLFDKDCISIEVGAKNPLQSRKSRLLNKRNYRNCCFFNLFKVQHFARRCFAEKIVLLRLTIAGGGLKARSD